MGAETNPISPDPAIRDAAVAHLDRVMECGQAFGCEILCGPIHSAIGVFSGEGPTEDEFKYGVETLQRAAEKAQARGIRIAIEYLNRFEIYFLTTAAQTARFVRAVDHPYCKMMYDSFHAHIEEKRPGRGDRVVCRRDDPRPRLGERPRHPRHRQVHWDGFFGGLEAERLRRLSDDRGLRPGPAGPGRGHAGSGATCSPTPMGLCRDGLAFIKSRHSVERLRLRTHRPRVRVKSPDRGGTMNRLEGLHAHASTRSSAGPSSAWPWSRLAWAQAPARPQAPRARAIGRRPRRSRGRTASGSRSIPRSITVEDGDGVLIRWGDRDTEIVRILGIDTPEVRRLEHNLPYDQPFGPEATGLRPGGLRGRDRGRAAALADPRPLRPHARLPVHQRPQLFGARRSRPATAARPSATTATTACRSEAAEVVAAAEGRHAPLPFEPPHQYRARMRTLAEPRSGASGRVSQGTERSRRGSLERCRLVGLKGERVRLVPPDRTLHLENALVWLNDPEITATLKYNLGVTRRQEELFFEQIETQRETTSSGRSSTKPSVISASSACTRSTGGIAGRRAACSSASDRPGAAAMPPTPSGSGPGSPSASSACTGSRATP